MTNVFDTHLSRRRLIAAGTTLAVGGTGLALATDDARAQAEVDMGTLDVADAEFSPDDGELAGLYLLVSGTYQYTIHSTPGEWTAYLLVGDGSGNTSTLATTSGQGDGQQASGTYGLRGNVFDASFYGPADVDAGDGEATVTIPVEVAYVLRDPNGGMLVQARVSDTAVVTVTPNAINAQLAGTGEFVAQDDASDPTPAEPEA